MTRINLVEPAELTDQHLFSERREILRVLKDLVRSLKALWRRNGIPQEEFDLCDPRMNEPFLATLKRVPTAFTLNTGHVTFFYDKMGYLTNRFDQLTAELSNRGLAHNSSLVYYLNGIISVLPEQFKKDYTATPQAITIIRERILSKLESKPKRFAYNKVKIDQVFISNYRLLYEASFAS